MRASLPLKGVAPVPLSPPEIVGIVRFEGQSISVFSLSNLIGEPGWNRDPAVLLVIEPTPGQLIAVDCEQIPTPFSVPASRVTAARTQAKDAVFPVVLEGGRRIQFVDLSALLDARNGARSS
jgi:purine-binding chemotaxis protein CheW